MEIVAVIPQLELECHCCTSSQDVVVCELDKCEYPLCSTCKEKALKIEHKCPGCRRVVIDISDDSDPDSDSDSDDELEPDLNHINRKCKCRKCKCRKCSCDEQCHDKVFNYTYRFIMSMFTLMIVTVIFFIGCLVGRIVSQMFLIGPRDFWCYSMGEHFFLFFIGYGLIGFVIGFFIICCGGGLLFECLCKEDDGY